MGQRWPRRVGQKGVWARRFSFEFRNGLRTADPIASAQFYCLSPIWQQEGRAQAVGLGLKTKNPVSYGVFWGVFLKILFRSGNEIVSFRIWQFPLEPGIEGLNLVKNHFSAAFEQFLTGAKTPGDSKRC